jgi:hypothetical protein
MMLALVADAFLLVRRSLGGLHRLNADTAQRLVVLFAEDDVGSGH